MKSVILLVLSRRGLEAKRVSAFVFTPKKRVPTSTSTPGTLFFLFQLYFISYVFHIQKITIFKFQFLYNEETFLCVGCKTFSNLPSSIRKVTVL